MSKPCSIKGCNKTATKRGTTCGPYHAQLLRGGITEDKAARENETHEVKGDSWTVALDATRIKTLDQLVAHCEVDTRVWEVDRFVCNKWEVGAKDSSDKLQVEPLFQVKAWFKKKVSIANAIADLAAIKAEAKKFAPKYKAIVYPKRTERGNIAEIGLPDIHIGKLAWSKETMDEDYDTPIAVARYREALASVLGRVRSVSLDRILLVIGNDLIQIDGSDGKTTAGTQVDYDGRYSKIYKVVRQMLVEEIEKLRLIAPVKVIVVPGNHDRQTAFTIGDSIEMRFYNCPDVEVENEPTPRKYYQHGNVLLMWCHGDQGKRQDYPILMATEKSEMFGSTVYRECHTGHLHTTRLDEKYGVRTRILPSLCPADYWHSASGYVGNIKTAELYVWNDVEGLILQAYHNISHRSKA